MTVPGAAPGLTATAGNGQVTLSWTAPASGGVPITGYNVYQGTSPGGEARVPVNGASLVTSPYTVTGLNNGTTYYFRVTAVNRVGEGPASAEAKAVPVTVPGAPTGLTVTPGDARVTLSWTASASDGGSPVTGYNVYYATSADFKGAAKIPRGHRHRRDGDRPGQRDPVLLPGDRGQPGRPGSGVGRSQGRPGDRAGGARRADRDSR